jgi:hypothetical protein
MLQAALPQEVTYSKAKKTHLRIREREALGKYQAFGTANDLMATTCWWRVESWRVGQLM